jgi:hypothetical protein
VLDRRGAGGGAQLAEHPLANLAGGAGDPQLDELVRLQDAVDLGEQRRREAALPDEHDRLQAVRATLEYLTFGGRKLFRHDDSTPILEAWPARGPAAAGCSGT